jgi:hypothetical protein
LRTDERARATFGGPVSGSAHELFDPVERSEGATTPPPSDGAEATTTMRAAGAGGPHQFDDDEPPEEPLDPAVSRVVATLDVEVVVVDEQPRYHVAGCQALVAQTLIPLPVREAVELGFTPCGWCTPDAVLGARHRTSVRP